MSSFDEGKITRDEHGRFSSGLAGFVAKHTGQLPKLEGYQGDKPGLATWASAKVGGRARDIEIPLARKTEEHIANTGALPFEKVREQSRDPRTRMVELGSMQKMQPFGMLANDYRKHEPEVQKLAAASVAARRASEDAEKAMNKAAAASNKADDKRDAAEKMLSQMRTEKPISSNPEDVVAHEKQVKDMEKQVKRAQTSATKALAKAKETAEASKKADHEWDKATNDYEAAHDAQHVRNDMKSALTVAIGHVAASDTNVNFEHSTVEVTHDRKDGSMEIHLQGQSHSETYPGEKSLTIRVEHATDVNNPAKWSIVSQYPTDRRGKDHPNQVDTSGNLGGEVAGQDNRYMRADAMKKAIAEHIKKFSSS